ncbi:subtype I-C CRISPR-associated endonuclease Cas1 [Clostridium thermosuccinogenes]|mgnify:CR=1 FL=1|uniref:CRISPR-associated endonuclease Cas1 n=1 Tax=Clostridium thermosuccinogenes TaxID=84032 RepID=A0A2K2FR16_9CLOT|nr:type I-C CRISPR-associated endonuclease Cas1c [Pseudoclostridium thermosuccinogenes]AUS96944.1 subtype I-C CRISPR-associated endonuclease Cas1 [Pseudoclostridium thermosuccinogenes]PNT99639.1 subtype I-C CRISPR-associated endonuclease Cas1 [Pseudoclostridium thermosuccinogenes]PNU01227.1 subtype I-C CRISPR-associated endonuclease Cas1 [Pseudoclostridium thermosuccinogenes]
MRKLLNTLYVTSPNSYLTRDGDNIVIKEEDKEKLRIPAHNLESVICFNYAGASPSLMSLCAEKGISLSFLSPSGYFYARVTGKVNGNVLLRRKQYRVADNLMESSAFAKNFIIGKVYNSRAILQRALREYKNMESSGELQRASDYLNFQLMRLDNSENLETVRGIEGESAHIYFSCFNHLIINQKESFLFSERNRRPPLDNVNALLSFLYTLLMHDVQAALETVGLDPYVGFLHRDRPGRASLALDLMEELRPYLADRMTLSLINKRQVDSKGFVSKESGAVIMDDDTRKVVITAWQKRKQEEIMHPYINEKIPVGLLPYVQAMLLARTLRGEIDEYPPFLIK